jgi:hypothetical protein
MRYAFIIFIFTFSLYSEEIVKVIATGMGSDIEKARKIALRNCIEQVIGVKIESETYVKNYITIKDDIFAKSEGFIHSYKVIWTERDDSGVTVSVEANVLKTSLLERMEKLGVVLAGMDQPRILVVPLNEEEERYNIKFYRSLVGSLTGNGFFILDKESLEQFHREQKDVSYSELNNRIADFGLKVNADYIIKFDLYSEDRVGYVDCEVIATSTGKIIDISSLDTGKKNIGRRSIAVMGTQIGERLFKSIKNSWEVRIKEGKYYTLVVEGYKGYQSFLSFSTLLEDVDYVKSVTEIESGSNKSTILVIYKGKRSDFKREVFNLFTTLKWSVRVVRSENSKMIIKVLE